MRTRILAIVLVTACSIAPVAQAQVGDPTGVFGIRITQGDRVIVDNPAVTVPGDVKINDGDPEGFVQIGAIGMLNSPIILKIVSDDDPFFRFTRWNIDVPAGSFDINTPGPVSLFDPFDPATIAVEISNLAFVNTGEVTAVIFQTETFLAAFMRNALGLFYILPGGVPFANNTQSQVPGTRFCDANTAQYSFSNCDFNSIATPRATWAWRNIPNPGLTAGVVGSPPSANAGFVFELALAVAFIGRPTPGFGGDTGPEPLPIVDDQPPPIDDGPADSDLIDVGAPAVGTCGAGSLAAIAAAFMGWICSNVSRTCAIKRGAGPRSLH